MAEEKKKAKKKVKLATAQKRILQSERREAKNRAYRSKVSTLVRSLKEAATKKDAPLTQSKLATMHSLLDKGVKTGVFKANKAARVKSRLSKLARV